MHSYGCWLWLWATAVLFTKNKFKVCGANLHSERFLHILGEGDGCYVHPHVCVSVQDWRDGRSEESRCCGNTGIAEPDSASARILGGDERFAARARLRNWRHHEVCR